MYKVYFRQAIQMLKQNKFISIISILGTALAIMMIMTIIVTDRVKNISIAPEDKRERTFYISFEERQDTARGNGYGGFVRKDIVTDYLSKLKTPELVSAFDATPSWIIPTESIVHREGSREGGNFFLRKVDANFWKIYNFDFVEGAPFSREEFDSGMPVAVISESAAREFFNRDEFPVGKTLLIDFNPYRVVGVVKDVSPVFKKAQGSIWIPYTNTWPASFEVALLARNLEDFPAIYQEVRDVEKRFEAVNANYTLELTGPVSHKIGAMDVYASTNQWMEDAVKVRNRKMVFILLVLLLVPAVNLSGFSLSRMKKRMAEIGIRKAFGAKKYTILTQVLYENMITSLIGGIIGLLFSFGVVYFFRHWLLGVPAEHAIPVGTLVSAPVFLAVFIVCILINLLSAGLPAYRASRATIVDSLTQNDK